MARREFHFIEGTASKFWAIELNGTTFSVHYGRIGTTGQAQEKTFATDALAKKEYDKLVAEKLKKGYSEQGASATVVATPPPAPRAAAPKATAPPKPKDTAAVTSDAVAVAETAAVVAAPVPATGTASPSAESSPAPKQIPFQRRVKIEDSVRARLTWTEQFKHPAVRPAPPQFSEHYKRLMEDLTAFNIWNLEIPHVVSKEEALFWVDVLHSGQKYSITLTKNPTFNALIQSVKGEVCYTYFSYPQILVHFLSPLQIAKLFIDWDTNCSAKIPVYRQLHGIHMLPRSFSTHIVPYMSVGERDEFRSELEELYDGESDKDSRKAVMVLGMLATVGSTRVTTWISRATKSTTIWMNNSAYDGCGPLSLFVGVQDEDTFVNEATRLIDKLGSRNDFRLWIAATEWRHLNILRHSVTGCEDKSLAAVLARTLGLVEAPENALPMLEIYVKSKAQVVAAEWFANNPLHTAIGLVPTAMGRGELAESAQMQLLLLHRRGQDDVLRSAIPHLTDGQAAWLKSQIIDNVLEQKLEDIASSEIPEPLRSHLSQIPIAKPVAWLEPSLLPPLKLYGKKMGAADVNRLLNALKSTALDEPSPLFNSLHEHVEPNSLDIFAWTIFLGWMGLGAPSKDKWALLAVGRLGGDASVLKLTPLVREWPGESQHARAVLGLQCLKAIGTDVALMALNGIAQKLKFKGLKEQAQKLMNDIAARRGLTRDQLADRIVPDCDLDERGTREFDFGPRKFHFVLGSEMKPLVRDSEGKVRPDLPAPNKHDDAEKAAAAVAEWKLLKKTLREVLKIQAERLEDAMITGRRWSTEEFNTLLLKHPLMVNLVRQIVFGAYDKESCKLLKTFRGTEDLTLADENDDPAEIPEGSSIGIVHPAHLEGSVLSAWGQLLSDYEIIPPFQQLGRTICRPEPEELDKTAITRYKGAKIEGIIVYGMLERSHWLRDTPADGGCFNQHSKYFPAANCTAFIHYEDGLSMGYYDEEQEITEVYFCPGHVEPEMWGEHKKRLKIGQVDKVAMSEVLRMANAIHSKAKA